MSGTQACADYYAILGVSNTATVGEITKSYRMRARVVHPDKNPENPNATAEFQLLNEAHETLKDKQKRSLYDIRWPGIYAKERAEKDAERRKSEAAEASRQKAAQEATRKAKESSERQASLKRWTAERNRYIDDIFEGNRRVRRLAAEVAKLQALDDDEVKREKANNSWWTYLSTSFSGKVSQETEEENRKREMERLQRVATKRIKTNELDFEKRKVQGWGDLLASIEAKIAAENKKRDDEIEQSAAKEKADMERKQAAARQAQYEKQAEEMRRKVREAERVAREQRAQEEAARLAAERKRQEELDRFWEEVARQQDEQRERETNAARTRARARQDQSAASSNASTSTKSKVCRHNGFWPRVEKGQICGNCKQYQPRFVLQCPGCKMKACAACQRSLRGDKGRAAGSQPHANRRYRQENTFAGFDFD